MRRLFQAVVLSVLIVVAAPSAGFAAEATFRDGLNAYNLRDYGRAFAIWTRLADRNDRNAQASLGYMYYAGHGVNQNSRRASELFYRAANQGETTAQLFLAVMHYNADGVAASPSLALMWCELAMAGGQPEAFEWRGRIMADLSQAERLEAWRLVAEWYRIRDTTTAR